MSMPPGTAYLYSNLGFSLLGGVLANHDGMTWIADLHQAVLTPLGMTDTDVYEALTTEQRSRLAQGYAAGNFGTCTTPPCAVPYLSLWAYPPPAANPSGGIFVTPTDMMTWLGYNLGMGTNSALNALLPILRMPRFTATGAPDRALAWNISNLSIGGMPASVIWKDGDNQGFHSFIAYVPTLHIGVFVLVNFTPSVTAHAISDQILQRLP
jgi:CubicO group peptidase (beta-lactamase class C family)